MRLELADFPVKEVKFGKRTGYHGGVLEIDKEEMAALALQDSRVTSFDMDVAFPGEQTRIANVRHVVEPRVKVSGPGCVFPGVMGPVETVGEGRTHKMSGMTVISSVERRSTIPSGTAAQDASILDMWGPGAQITPFSSTINVVPVLKLNENVSEWDAHAAVQLAAFKVANRLAEATRDMNPETEQVFELNEVDPSLPRVIYVMSFCTVRTAPHTSVAYYGIPVRESQPSLIHPNELFDGALTQDARRGSGGYITDWAFLNQPLVLRLYQEHGKRLNFLGVIMESTDFPTEGGKQAQAKATAQTARILGANNAIVTRINVSGNSFIEVMLTVQACVKNGIKTVLMVPEWGGLEGTDLPFVFYVPEATAMVSTGTHERLLELPAPAKVIGVGESKLMEFYTGDKPFSPWNELTLEMRREITGGLDWFGGMNYACREY
jgi:glycine reductase